MLILLILAFELVEIALIYVLTPITNNPWNFFWIIPMLLGFFALNSLVALLYFYLRCVRVDIKKDMEKPNYKLLYEMKQVLEYLFFILRAPIHFINKELIPTDQRYLLILNHVSSYDHLAIVAALPACTAVSISKAENDKKFFTGKFQHGSGFIPIERDNPMGAVKSILTATHFIKNDYASILLSPEGTRSKDGLTHEFHPVCFKIATKTQCPIVLVSCVNTDFCKSAFKRFKTDIYIKVNKVLYYDDYKDMSVEELAKKSHDIVVEGIDSLKDKNYQFKN